MARPGGKSSRKRPRRRHWLDEETSENLPAHIPVDLKQLPKETADTTRKWLEWLKATEPSSPPRASINRPFGPKSKRKAKRGARGAPVKYDTDGGITAAAEAVAERGVDELQSVFIEKVYDELTLRRIKAPGLTWMKRHIGPLHKRLKRDARGAKAAQKPPTNKAGR